MVCNSVSSLISDTFNGFSVTVNADGKSDTRNVTSVTVNTNGELKIVPATEDTILKNDSFPRCNLHGTSAISTAFDEISSEIHQVFYHCFPVPEPVDVIFNGTTTIVKFADGTKTVSKPGEGETFDRYTGFMSCIVKKMFGGTTPAKKVMNMLDKGYAAKKAQEKFEKEKAERIAKQKKQEELALKHAIERRAREIMIENEARKLAEDKLHASK